MMKTNGNNLLLILGLVLAVAFVSSFVAVAITGNAVNSVSSNNGGWKFFQKVCPRCTYTSKPIYLRLYERHGENDPGTASRIVLDHPLGADWENLIQLNRIADADQEPPVTSVGLDIQKESGYEYLVLGLNENNDVDFGRIMVNIELTQINEDDGYIVIKLVRK